MYHGYLSPTKASQQGLDLQLTTWHAPDDRFHTVHDTPYSRILAALSWETWCEIEAKRIGGDVARHAAVVKRKATIAVFVNQVAGDPQDESEATDEADVR